MGQSQVRSQDVQNLGTGHQSSLGEPDETGPLETILTVFFEGTGNTLKPVTTQIGIFASMCAAQILTPTTEPASIEGSIFKMAYDGCGVTNGIAGTLFAAGLASQCDEVVAVIRLLVKTGVRRLRVNALGLSRGGIACMLLAKRIQAEAEKIARACFVDLCMLLFDPVPGNLVNSGFPWTKTDAWDLTKCYCLKRVLALYPCEPLPDFTLHAPMLGAYPDGCEVEEDVTLGCHQGALFRTQSHASSGTMAAASNLSYCRIYEFLQSVGTGLQRNLSGCYHPSRHECLAIFRAELQQERPSTRCAHDHSRKSRFLVRRSAMDRPRFLNRHHERLEQIEASSTNSDGTRSEASVSKLAPLGTKSPQYMLDICSKTEAAHFPGRGGSSEDGALCTARRTN
mmetsp:Transcript_24257/g.56330  ORF Transcript_24257/g.56330 Transcript_24257/m.56330 type:complete len:397 (+) Transcript_24257:156-1346(+)